MADLMKIEEVTAEYHIPLATLRHYVQTGKGPRSFRLGRRRVWKREDVEAWIEKAYETTSTGGAA
jgi:predicted DNA-binding transcriptional regulator AlpA